MVEREKVCALDCVRFSIKLVWPDELTLSLLQKLVTVARVGSWSALLRSLSGLLAFYLAA